MKKLSLSLIGGLLLFGSVACTTAQTSQEAPADPTTQGNVETMEKEEAKETQEDATSEVRRDQLDSDIRAREQRNDTFNDGQAVSRDDSDLASEVRSKLEANLPASALAVEAEEGVVTIDGTVPTQEQYDKIDTLAREIKGVQDVKVNAKVAPAQPNQ